MTTSVQPCLATWAISVGAQGVQSSKEGQLATNKTAGNMDRAPLVKEQYKQKRQLK